MEEERIVAGETTFNGKYNEEDEPLLDGQDQKQSSVCNDGNLPSMLLRRM